MNQHLLRVYATALVLLALGLIGAPVGHALADPGDGDPIVLEDDLNGSTVGAAYGAQSYVQSLPTLANAIDLGPGSYVRYEVPGWYQWSHDYDPTAKEGTIEFWINPTSYPQTILNLQWYLSESPPASGYILGLALNEEGRLTYGHWSSVYTDPKWGAIEDPTSSQRVPLHHWTYVAASWGPAGTRLYLNGNLAGESADNAYPALNPTFYVYLNGWGEASSGHKAIDGLRITRVQQTDAEVRARYETLNPPDVGVVITSVADPGDGTCTPGECTLREALALGQLWVGRTIAFNIPGRGPHTIQPLSELPLLSPHMTIDGYTQPGAVHNTNPITAGLNSVLMIELDGSLAGSATNGLYMSQGGVTGLVINRFGGHGVVAVGETSRVYGNYIGTDVTGKVDMGNGRAGVVSGDAVVWQNLISGNGGDGISGAGLTDAFDNLIGTDVTGKVALGNQGAGLAGGWHAEFRRNVIAANAHGIVTGERSGPITDNVIGAGDTGDPSLGNLGDGIRIECWPPGSTCGVGGIDNNQIVGNGGAGIRSLNAYYNLSGNQISQNAGGGLIADGGVVHVERTTIAGNFGKHGGGVSLLAGELYLANSTISGNHAKLGGGVAVASGTLFLSNVTIADNEASSGGGIAGVAQLENTIVAGNRASNPAHADCAEAVMSLGYNLASDDSCGLAGPGDLVDADPLLGPLQDNGGPTWTHALLPGSPAIDAGSPAECPAIDQRGVWRPQPAGGICDIGAFEAEQSGTPPARLTLRVDAQPDRPRNFRLFGAFGLVRLDDSGQDDGDPYGASVTYSVPPGEYSFALSVPYRWFVTAITCSRPNAAAVELAQAKVTLRPQMGERIVCTFVAEYNATLYVRSYRDKNGNGLRDGGEPWMANWWSELYRDDGSLLASNFTNAAGKWNVFDLRPGTYTLCQKPQPGWNNTQPGGSDPNHGNWPCYTVDLGPDQLVYAYFGYTDQVVQSGATGVQSAAVGLQREDGVADLLNEEMYTAAEFVDVDALVPDDSDSPEPASGIYLPFAGR